MRAATLTLLVVFAISIARCNVATNGNTKVQEKNPSGMSSASVSKLDSASAGKEAASSRFVTVPVTVIPTSDAMKGQGMYSDRYPSDDNLSQLDGFADQIQEYGGAYRLWPGPRGWTGFSAVGVDGNVLVKLYPIGGSDTSGPRINYTLVPACEGCMLSAAAPFFHHAMQTWNLQYNQDGSMPIVVPSDLKADSLSPTLVRFSIPDSSGDLTWGVVYFDETQSSEVPFAEARFVLPQADSALAQFLSLSFIKREGLK